MESKLQIISGTLRGKKLSLPPHARPTQNRARLGLFNTLMSALDQAPSHVWDAFAGSGAFGIECLSRFPDVHVVFSDVAPATVRKNLASVSVGPRATVVAGDAMTLIHQYAPVSNLIFVDPPYADADVGAAFVRRAGLDAAPGTLLIWEQDRTSPRDPGDAWTVWRDKTYGRARFLFLKRVG